MCLNFGHVIGKIELTIWPHRTTQGDGKTADDFANSEVLYKCEELLILILLLV